MVSGSNGSAQQSHQPNAPAPGALHAWAVALRPRSLFISLSPVLVGTALAYACRGRLDAIDTLLVFGAALNVLLFRTFSMQIWFGLLLAAGLGMGDACPA